MIINVLLVVYLSVTFLKENISVLVQRTSQTFKQILCALVYERSLHGIYNLWCYNFQRFILWFLEAIPKFYSILEHSKVDLFQYNRVYHSNKLLFFPLGMEVALHCGSCIWFYCNLKLARTYKDMNINIQFLILSISFKLCWSRT